MFVVQRPKCSIVESFSVSKNGELDGGGDRLILGCRFRGVVDAATEKFGRTWVIAGQEMSGERAMATVLGQYLTESAEPLWDILKAVQRELQAAAVTSGIDLSQPGASPLASLVVFDSYTRSLYNLGDCSYGLLSPDGFRSVYNERRVDHLAANRRAEVLAEHLGREGGVVAGDPGRAAIVESLKEACLLANANPLQFSSHDTLYGVPKSDLVYSVFDAISIPTISLPAIPQGTAGLVLSSDGYPRIFPTLHESEAYLERSLAVDPLRMKEHPSTKGVAPGAVSYDDRTYLRLSI
jgi:hypothetical protein